MNYKYIYFFIFLIVVILLVSEMYHGLRRWVEIQETYRRTTYLHSCNHFDTAEINDRIYYLNKVPRHGDAFSFARSPKDTFYTFIIPVGKQDFSNFAIIGDSVVKHSFSDTLILIKDGIRYKSSCERCINQ